MALRSLARLWSSPQAMQATTLRHFSIPTVYESMYDTTVCHLRSHAFPHRVQFQVMDPKGNRRTLRGLEGQKLNEVLFENMEQLDLGDSTWTR